MKIKDLIDTLTALSILVPDIEVECRNEDGQFYPCESQAIVVSGVGGQRERVIRLDT